MSDLLFAEGTTDIFWLASYLMPDQATVNNLFILDCLFLSVLFQHDRNILVDGVVLDLAHIEF